MYYFLVMYWSQKTNTGQTSKQVLLYSICNLIIVQASQLANINLCLCIKSLHCPGFLAVMIFAWCTESSLVQFGYAMLVISLSYIYLFHFIRVSRWRLTRIRMDLFHLLFVYKLIRAECMHCPREFRAEHISSVQRSQRVHGIIGIKKKIFFYVTIYKYRIMAIT